MFRRLVTAPLAIALAASPALAQDAKKGERVFKRCAACHNVDTDKNKVGPHLMGIIGREAGAVDGLSLIHISEPTRLWSGSRIPSSA